MTESCPGNPDDVAALAERCYDQLISYGADARAYNPIVNMQGAARGEVYWPEEEAGLLAGFQVDRLGTGKAFPEDIAELETIGFTQEMQREGLWIIHDRYKKITADKERLVHPRTGTPCTVHAHFNPMRGAWHVAYLKENPLSPVYAENWDLTDHLQRDEREVVERVARETAMLVDAAVTLQENHSAYYALRRHLLKRAEATSEDDWQSMIAVLEPWKTWPAALENYFAPSTYSQLENYAPALYRALAGKGPHNSSDLEVLQALTANPGGQITGARLMIDEATICPAYEPTDIGLMKPNVPALVIS